MSARWWSQPFAEEGSATAEGIINQLGRPTLDELTVLVREAAQNSWDARTGTDTVDFSVRVTRLGDFASAWIRRLMPAPEGGAVADLAEYLQPESVIVTVSDRNTRGLGGPVRAGSKAPEGTRSDFVQFLRNVGEARDNEFGGGTYGFGKGIFYRLSGASTILVDSYIADGSDSERRLMGAALGASFYNNEERRFTGRHWWGDVRDGIPDPVLGENAASLSDELGLPGFADGRTGTDIVIVGAQLDSRDSGINSLNAAGEFIASSILWNLWPKLVRSEAETAPMRFSVEVNGRPIQVPDPSNVPHLRPFAEALRIVRADGGTPHTRKSAPRHVGRLATELGAAEAPSSPVVDLARPFVGAPHHVARMRLAELVVDYLPGPEHPDPFFSYGGVFRSTVESDEHFAAAEPPTHDDWVEAGLRGTSRGVVQNARHFVRRALEEKFGVAVRAQARGAAGLGVVAARLARLTPGISAGGATRDFSRPVSARGRRSEGTPSRSARILEGPALHVFGDRPFVVTRVSIPGGASGSVWHAETSVVLDGGGRESATFAGARIPTVLEWRPVDGGPSVAGSAIMIGPGADSEWWVYATYVEDAVVRVTIRRSNGAA
ncbi:hypothetical protein DEI92_09615 [Curtobacterium sp. MCBD17_034]|uniref:hypothetical protein n=1 Tax=unclassified Curtobacterium TaxID=257496 RepID=UPI000DA750FB|nr:MULTISPECIES: hypothetical protein [unclassified Curtobacterium]PZF59238.1 hypothetical protein DEI92_09615 [Curtobacterium sp. MCBD17_034]PZM34220.1 hypothetical protein DEI90_08520 [Curtobacterium sp. MCBD17_031]